MKNTLAFKLIVILALCLSKYANASCFSDDSFLTLDYGLYWYGSAGNCQKAEPGEQNSFYDPNNPTIILFHGWQFGNVSSNERTTFNAMDSDGPDIDTAAIWRVKGWNIGIMYWTQFADELEVADAEAKIWASNGPQGMRWLSADGNYRSNGLPQSIGDEFTREIIDNMADFSGPNFRLSGHSLGSQLALLVSLNLHDSLIPRELQPQRVALLDPFSTNNGKSYLGGDWVGERMRDIAVDLKSRDVVIEAYRSSAVASTIFIGDSNDALLDEAAYTELRPWYFNALQIGEKHSAAIWHYFWSFDFDTPRVLFSNSRAISASSSDDAVRDRMNSNRSLQHFSGMFSESPNDDVMRLIRR